MNTVELKTKIFDFIDKNYRDKMLANLSHKKNRLTVDFHKMLDYDHQLCDHLLDFGEEFISTFEKVLREMFDDVSEDFRVRFRNCEKSANISINLIRASDIGKFVTVKGMVKQKSSVRAHITSTKFECPVCGLFQTILQLDEKEFIEPNKCSCGRRTNFKVVMRKIVDVYSMMLEEPTEELSGGTKLSQIRILCRADLSHPEIERKLFQGVKVDVSGVLRDFQIKSRNNQTTSMLDWYIEANYIKIHDESFLNIKWTKEEEEKFKELACKPDWLDRLRHAIFYDVYRSDEECKAVILQMFGGVERNTPSLKSRGNINILLVGDPGCSKSSILKIAKKFSPKAMYVAGTGISGCGLTATAVKDELIGGYTLEAGALALCNNGILMIDELDKVSDENKKALHEPLSDCTISVSKAGIQATLIAKTAVLAAANPKHGNYSEYDSLYSQIDLASSLVSRFDFVFPIKRVKNDDEYHAKVCAKIIGRGTDDNKPEFERDFIIKYISFAKTITPVLNEAVERYITKEYVSLMKGKDKSEQTGEDGIPVNPRSVGAFVRTIDAVARSHLHTEITVEDAKIGCAILVNCYRKMGINPDSGEIVETVIDGKPFKQKDLASMIISLIRDRSKQNNELMNIEDLFSILESRGFNDRLKIEKMIQKLKDETEIFSPKSGFFKLI